MPIKSITLNSKCFLLEQKLWVAEKYENWEDCKRWGWCTKFQGLPMIYLMLWMTVYGGTISFHYNISEQVPKTAQQQSDE